MGARPFPTTTDINFGALSRIDVPEFAFYLCFSRWCARVGAMLYDAHHWSHGELSDINVCGLFPPLPCSHLPHTMMAPPSSCRISGVFSLSEGSRNTEPSYYATYLSALEFTDDEKFINISIRKFTTSSDILYTDNSFVFVVAKAVLPAGGDGMLDSIHCVPFTSPPEGYPPEPTHTAFVTGTVSGVNDNGSIRSFTLTTSEYVCDEWHSFNIRFVFHQVYLAL